jgi:hypothetical protein
MSVLLTGLTPQEVNEMLDLVFPHRLDQIKVKVLSEAAERLVLKQWDIDNPKPKMFFERMPGEVLANVMDYMMSVDSLRLVDEALSHRAVATKHWHKSIVMNSMNSKNAFFKNLEYDSREALNWVARIGVLSKQYYAVKIAIALRGKWRTELTWACDVGLKDVVSSLLKRKGINANDTDNGGWTPLTYAAFEGHTEVARLLINYGAHVNGEDHHKRTPLHEACRNGHFEAAQLFVNKGADVNRKNYTGWSPLHLSQFFGHNEIFKYLLTKGARMDLEHDVKKGSGEGWELLRKVSTVDVTSKKESNEGASSEEGVQ